VNSSWAGAATATATIALAARSFSGLPMNGETVNISADKPSGEGGTSGKGGSKSKDARRDTIQSSPGSGLTAGSAALPSQDSANILSAENSETTLLRDLGSEDRTDPASLAVNGADELDAGYVSIPGDALGATIPDIPAQTAGVVSGVIAEDLFGSDGSNGLIAGDQPATDVFNAFESNFQLQDQAPVDAFASAPEPASLLLFGAALIGTIVFAKIEGLWQSPM
jgi:PEP-CTERM motif